MLTWNVICTVVNHLFAFYNNNPKCRGIFIEEGAIIYDSDIMFGFTVISNTKKKQLTSPLRSNNHHGHNYDHHVQLNCFHRIRQLSPWWDLQYSMELSIPMHTWLMSGWSVSSADLKYSRLISIYMKTLYSYWIYIHVCSFQSWKILNFISNNIWIGSAFTWYMYIIIQ